MIALPPGCTVPYTVQITVSKLTDEMLEWYEMVGGEVNSFHTKTYNHKTGNEIVTKMVRYNNSKWCHRFQDGTSNVRLNFSGEDAYVASVFLIKFNDEVVNHNFRENEYK
jgi:hypothetical protein